ncbi:hypothetical protein CLHUN_05810 [Ruminiclostridium hungatei]|uniref:SAF domain-containing protein n=1 Tax=Ruminiclostridium hungatei TaxID=48256 RepID=A0A1V4SP76_RUMHU|nr:SAF domain-containing protein [Ruminiclostridium hungatei]OPX45644.1 hypothetical protein CLHUN_05810 [Ruminiclostridium hungatei]
MKKRIIIKTMLICIGIFLILDTLILTYTFKKYPLDLEEYIPAIIAASDIQPGTVIEPKHIRTKLIQYSAFNQSMEKDANMVIGKKVSRAIGRNDYLRKPDLIERDDWYSSDARIITVPVNIEERLANLIKRGSYIDIRIKRESSQMVETALKKVRVEDVLDENGNPIDAKAGVNSRTAYLKLILGEAERQKIYTSLTEGKLIYELYCDENQD